ncbi:EI24 domain-containing protein [Paracoccaceae bacterium Fryx2]|nr:EI24 domain-containing protein [Paracoccaceae bacterium Fryx2]
MFADFLRALRQLGDRRFRRVLLLGLALTLALLTGVYAAFLVALQAFTPDMIEIPFVGPVGGIDTLVSWGSAVFMLGLSVFLMVPVASAFTGLFLEDVAQAVEDRHYPALPPVPRPKLMDSLIDTANFFALILAVNLVALLLYPFAGPFVPVLFWAVNGFLLGREYFTLVAMRRLGRPGAKALRARYPLQIWLAGTLMAAPLSVPLLNLLIPMLGAATFTHLFHRLNGERGV